MRQQELEILLKDLQSTGKECEWIEYKVNDSNPQEIGEYLSALSNSAYYLDKPFGYLVFGIENETYRLTGTNFYPSKEKIGNQELENWIATQLNPRIDFNIFEFDFNNNHFVIIRIDSAPNQPVLFRGTAFIRIGSYKKNLLDHPEKARKIWSKPATKPFELLPAAIGVNADAVLKLINYPKYFDLCNLPLPDNKNGILERFLHEKIIFPNGDNFDISNLGAILFAKDLENFETLARKIRVISYVGNDRIKTKKEQVGKQGYAIGFEGLNTYILNQLPQNEIIEKALRKQVSIFPPLAIRELVANAIIHQDFGLKGVSPMIEIFDNRIEISNPGKPLIDTLRFIDHNPQSRNEVLAKLMRRLNVCEERGSGVDKVVFECEYNQLPAPEIIAGDNYTRIILYAHKSMHQMDKSDKIRACYLHACLRHVSGESMTNKSLRQRFGIEEQNYSIVSRIIAETKDANLIKDQDPENKSRTHAKYLPFWA